jgi:nicotinate dehydrogenase subunit A
LIFYGSTLTVNGSAHELDIDPATPLLYAMRGELELNGAKFGCGLGQCGACTVVVDGEAIYSCLIPVVAVQGRSVTTIEGLGTSEKPGSLQQAFIDEQAAQCGYCTAGMIMRAQALLDHNPSPSEADIRDQMEPNLCRCGTHMRIVRAIRRARDARRLARARSARGRPLRSARLPRGRTGAAPPASFRRGGQSGDAGVP